MSTAWEQDYLEKLPRFPQPMPQRYVAGRRYLTKADLHALYFATYRLPCPRGWKQPFTVGHYWRAALVVFFNYGVDTASVKPKHDVETGDDKSWALTDLRKTCATYYDAHMPESSIEIVGHSAADANSATHSGQTYSDLHHTHSRTSVIPIPL